MLAIRQTRHMLHSRKGYHQSMIDIMGETHTSIAAITLLIIAINRDKTVAAMEYASKRIVGCMCDRSAGGSDCVLKTAAYLSLCDGGDV